MIILTAEVEKLKTVWFSLGVGKTIACAYLSEDKISSEFFLLPVRTEKIALWELGFRGLYKGASYEGRACNCKTNFWLIEKDSFPKNFLKIPFEKQKENVFEVFVLGFQTTGPLFHFTSSFWCPKDVAVNS